MSCESTIAPSNHYYNTIANKYDDQHGFWYEPLAKILIPFLKPSPDDKIVDIGGGTGAVAEKILALSGTLKNPICVVDPSQGLIEKAKKRPNIIAICTSADEFLASEECCGYNKFLFCRSSHHLLDKKKTFMALYKRLQPGSICVVIAGGKRTSLPLWKSLREDFTKDMHVKAEDLESCGFETTLTNVELIGHVTKEQWYEKIRSRIFSTLEELSDEEIEAGITEINNTLLSDVDIHEEISIKHDMRCIVALKI